MRWGFAITPAASSMLLSNQLWNFVIKWKESTAEILEVNKQPSTAVGNSMGWVESRLTVLRPEELLRHLSCSPAHWFWRVICDRYDINTRYSAWLPNHAMTWADMRTFAFHCTPKIDQFQISPAVSPEISRKYHHTEWRTWVFVAYSDDRLLVGYLILTTSVINFLQRLGECTFWTWEWTG